MPGWFDESALLSDTFLASVEQHAEIDSTSNRARELCCGESPPLPALIVAERQTAGRGRGAARWWASDGALLFTLVLDLEAAHVAEDRLSVVPLAMGVAVAEATAKFVAEDQAPWVKWPNDVYVGEKKLAGVLTESPVTPRGERRLTVGVGINLNNRFDGAPEEVRGLAVSVCELLGRELSLEERQAFLVGLLGGFAERLSCLGEGIELPPCPLAGRRVSLETPAGVVRGEYVGVDAAGALLLRGSEGMVRVVSGSELRVT